MFITLVAAAALVLPSTPPDNTPPAGFTALFNGKDLTGWKGLVEDPIKRASMPPDVRAQAQEGADANMRANWSVKDGVLTFSGKGQSICTIDDYGDFELYVDWKIEKGGDSGIYLRGSPQVQIWDNPIGSGGLYNNEKNPSKPLVAADRPVGQWNTFHIIMRNDRVTTYLNGHLVCDDTVMENYWDRNEPIFPYGQIELQNHGNALYFKNIYIRELPSSGAPRKDPRMEWWSDARFGMFIHWGLYAIPAGVWNEKNYPGCSEWLMELAKISPRDYEVLAPKFNPTKFDASEWAALAKKAGQKYMVVTSRHHDGFALFDSKYSEYDVMDAAPFKRDIMKELAEANAKEGLRMCWYHSILDWHHPDARGEAFPKYAEMMKNQVRELLTNYGPIGVMWFDGEWISEWTEAQGKELYNFCRELQPNVIVNNRVGKGRIGMAGMSRTSDAAGDFGTPEQEIPATGFPGYAWESCMTMNNSWGFHQNDHDWKSARTMIRMLIETSSKGGNFLLNVGPRADGTFPPEVVERLEAIGAWMDIHSEAIYGTGPSPFKKLAWGRATTRPGRVYLHVMEWPADGKLVVPGLQNDVRGAWLLSDKSMPNLMYSREGDDVVISVPKSMPNEDATVIAIDIAGEPKVAVARIQPAPDGTLTLLARDADIMGHSAKYEVGNGKDNIGSWMNANDAVAWEAVVSKPGRYNVTIEYACDNNDAGSDFKVAVGDEFVSGKVDATGAWTSFKTADLGRISVPAAGEIKVIVQPQKLAKSAVMNLKSLRLTPAK